MVFNKQEIKGLWPWTVNQMLTPKFWKLLKKDGFLKTYVRGHRSYRNPKYIAGTSDLNAVKQVGQDQFGNRYYEDFGVHHRNHRRWVEFADYFLGGFGTNGDRVPPRWHGWISYQYDDFPTKTGPQAFVNHEYLQPATFNLSNTPEHHKTPRAPQNINRMEFIEEQINRSRGRWVPEETGARFEGKKLIVKRNQITEDILRNKD